MVRNAHDPAIAPLSIGFAGRPAAERARIVRRRGHRRGSGALSCTLADQKPSRKGRGRDPDPLRRNYQRERGTVLGPGCLPEHAKEEGMLRFVIVTSALILTTSAFAQKSGLNSPGETSAPGQQMQDSNKPSTSPGASEHSPGHQTNKTGSGHSESAPGQQPTTTGSGVVGGSGSNTTKR
jgi:hypothetical protein